VSVCLGYGIDGLVEHHESRTSISTMYAKCTNNFDLSTMYAQFFTTLFCDFSEKADDILRKKNRLQPW
jgi:hypothetical protein